MQTYCPSHGAHAQRGLLYFLVCVSACVCVDDYFRATGYKRTIERYRRPQRYKGLKYSFAILLNDGVQEIWPENKPKANMLINTGLPRLLFARSTHREGIRSFTMDRQRV